MRNWERHRTTNGLTLLEWKYICVKKVLRALKCYCSWKSQARKTILWLTSALLVCKTVVRRDKTKFRTLVYLLSGCVVYFIITSPKTDHTCSYFDSSYNDWLFVVLTEIWYRTLPRSIMIMTSVQDTNELRIWNIFDTFRMTWSWTVRTPKHFALKLSGLDLENVRIKYPKGRSHYWIK